MLRAFRKVVEVRVALILQVLMDADFGGVVSGQRHLLQLNEESLEVSLGFCLAR